MKKVRIEPGCITCGMCEFLAPEIFEVTDVCHIKADAQPEQHAEAIKEAARACPVEVIVHEE